MEIRVGLLGLGNIGRTHAQAIEALGDPRVRLTAYTGGKADQPGLEDARSVTADQLLTSDDVDLVVIATPSELHAEQTVAAMRAGKGVVVEKPLATTLVDAQSVVETWRSTGAFGATISQRRLERQHVRLKELLDGGALGRPLIGEVLVHWWRDPGYYQAAEWRTKAPGGGVLMNQALHSVDLLTWLLGPATEVSGLTANLHHDIEAEDTATATVRFRNGAFGSIVASTATPPGRPARLTLQTTTGYVEIDHADITAWEFPGVDPPEPEDVASGFNDPAAIGFAGHLAQWQDIVEAYRTGRQPAITIADGLAAVELIDAVHRSNSTGTSVRVNQR